jgi:stage IV sporulation protein FB
MYATDTILTFGFPLGRLCGTRFRISFLMPLAAIALIWRLQSVELGVMAVGILIFSLIAHELAHLLVARSSGADMDEIRLWPLGGLAEPFGRGYFRDHARTMLAGPAMNLLLAISCMLALPAAYLFPMLNPFDGFPLIAGEPMLTTACRMAFFLNIILFAVNMIPVTPFDAGVLLRTYMITKFAEVESRDLMIRLGLITGILGMLIGFAFDVSTLVAISAFVLVLQIHDSQRWYETVNDADDFSEYDFSDAPSTEEFYAAFDPEDSSYDGAPPQTEVLDRWRDRREQERLQQEEDEREREAAEMDDVLQKLHVHGRESLNSREIHLLNRVSDRLRNRQQH